MSEFVGHIIPKFVVVVLSVSMVNMTAFNPLICYAEILSCFTSKILTESLTEKALDDKKSVLNV
jgi:hypothetical protein